MRAFWDWCEEHAAAGWTVAILLLILTHMAMLAYVDSIAAEAGRCGM